MVLPIPTLRRDQKGIFRMDRFSGLNAEPVCVHFVISSGETWVEMIPIACVGFAAWGTGAHLVRAIVMVRSTSQQQGCAYPILGPVDSYAFFAIRPHRPRRSVIVLIDIVHIRSANPEF
ncbi:hypothetical protein AcV5_002935 [Taiwanofungus camphoratus]|nr:hypothetical protein AcV5_002879 [Antrodia cinnamomea]KAI0918169.1 hypothetical protein AcV5_002935 [Antrodia cinnamomea]